MATTATSPAPNPAFPDVTRPSKYPVRLAASILEERRPDNRFFTAKFNHKPSQVGPKRTTTLTRLSGDDKDTASRLEVADVLDQDTTKVEYAGHGSSATDGDTAAFVLLWDREQEIFTLQPVEDEYNFNVVATPWERDAVKLRHQYKQIPRDEGLDEVGTSPKHATSSGSDDEDDLFSEEGEEPDKDKPFDFRHFLNAPPSPAVQASKAVSSSNTPLVLASSPARPSVNNTLSKASPLLRSKGASPLMKPKKHQRNISTSSLGPGRAAAAVEKGAAKKQNQEEPVKKKKEAKQAVPRVQLERKASIRTGDRETKNDNEDRQDKSDGDLDDDFLIIEGEDEPEDRVKPPAFRGTPSGGAPVSLSQLATSNSPAGFDRYSDDSEQDQDAEAEDEAEEATDDENDLGNADDNADEDTNGDVQSINLGTPAHQSEVRSPGYDSQIEAPTPRQQDDDDLDLEALEAVIRSGIESDEDDGGASLTTNAQRVMAPSSLRQVHAEASESESEEE